MNGKRLSTLQLVIMSILVMPFGANSTLRTLKEWFTSAPILQMPNPKHQFVVEVDASDTGVWAVLSQRAVLEQRLHPMRSSLVIVSGEEL